jgi:hypothetical protein
MGEPQLKIDPNEYDDEEEEYEFEDEEEDESIPHSEADSEPTEEEKPVKMIDKDQVESMIDALRKQKTIINDGGEEIDFGGQTKTDFINACEEGYPVIQRTLNSIYEIGTLLSQVRAKLKKKKLYHTWLKFIGLPERTAQNYVQAYDRFADRLPDFSSLGIKKLLIASKLSDRVSYVEKNLERLRGQTAQDLDKEVKAMLGEPVQKSGKVKSSKKIEIGGYKINPSKDGSRITIECTSKVDQDELIKGLSKFLSK